ncbi:hypothetical protein D3C71_1049230 [compost metagenome]
MHGDTLLTDTQRQPGKVAITRDDTETVKAVLMQKIHRIDDHGAIGGVLSRTICKLLHRLDGVIARPAFPAPHGCLCPVAIDAPDSRIAERRDHAEQPAHDFRRDIVTIDQHRQPWAFPVRSGAVVLPGTPCP